MTIPYDWLAFAVAIVTAFAGGALLRESMDGKPTLSLFLATLVLFVMNLSLVWLAMHK